MLYARLVTDRRSKRLMLLVLIANLVVALLCTAKANAQLTYYKNDLAGFNSASSAVIVESFANVTPLNVNLSSFTHNGITYTPLAPTTNVNIATPSNPSFTVARTFNVMTSSDDEYFRISFAQSQSAVGFDTYLNGFGPANISVYGASGLLGSTTHTHASNAIGFFGVTSATPITSIVWQTTNGGVINTAVGNIRATPASAPEATPLALVLLGGLVGGIAALRRKSALR